MTISVCVGVATLMPLGICCTTGCPRDRKSTRLNSSHSQISYAVFCLKKKKKTTCRDFRWSHTHLTDRTSSGCLMAFALLRTPHVLVARSRLHAFDVIASVHLTYIVRD